MASNSKRVWTDAFGGEEDHEGREDQVEGPEAGNIGGDGGQNDVE